MLVHSRRVTFQTQYFNAEGLKIRCDFWDTAGQDRFHVITQAYYAGSHGIILVYDAADHSEQSFQSELRFAICTRDLVRLRGLPPRYRF